MKLKVVYYDIENDSSIEKDCIDIHNDTTDNTFSFTPVDNPPKIYKAIVIDHPIVKLYQNKSGLTIKVIGYQYTKSGGYWRTETKIYSADE
jgi:hypothetical protein